MKISAAQMAAFSHDMRRRFEDQMTLHMRVRAADAGTLSPDALRARVRELIAVAEQHGIDQEYDIRRFLELVFDRSSEVLANPQVRAILQSPGQSSAAKVAFIADALQPRRG